MRGVKRAIGNPLVISTWKHGLAANETAMRILQNGGSCLDAVEAGARVPEADPTVSSVGYGGIPDRDGHVTLDASIMDADGNAGAVAFLEGIKHPVSVARLVMEKTKHVMLVGEGAKKFALAQGFKEENLLTEEARRTWLKKNKKSVFPGETPNGKSHDTIAILAQDKDGKLAGACTTSGWGNKMRGRVGDSPIIGAGLYVDNDVGAAGATGLGEEVIKTVGSFLVVELMRQGYEPDEACLEALQRILHRHRNTVRFSVAYIALRKDGKTGSASILNGFKYALYRDGKNILQPTEGIIK
ncbi:MAG: N(4)-(beta-N-acetylglucosaminyl)-L-asparaginase [FCB group bacterium]|nr:N(4)-(beta-N-acetylglucosaminyl)-L-asparaginase [FCB group bacterium]